MAEELEGFENLKKDYLAKIQEANVLVQDLETRKKQLKEALDWNQSHIADFETVKTTFEDFKKELNTANLKGLLESSTGFKDEIEQIKTSLAGTLKTASDSKTSVEKSDTEGKKTLDSINEIFKTTELLKKQIEGQNETVGKLTAIIASASENLEKVKLAEANWGKTSKENLESFEKSKTELLKKIEEEIEVNSKQAGELLGITKRATLATAFRNKKWEMAWATFFWNVIFVSSLIGMALIAIYYHDVHMDEAISKFGYGVGLLLKLPYLAPLFWLAYFAQGRSGLYSRLADDYGYKESVSIAFEGYKKQIGDMEATEKNKDKKPIEVLVLQTLEAIKHDPERIHDVYKPPKTFFEDLLAEKPEKGVNPESPKIVEVPGFSSMRKWLIAIGGSTAFAVLAIIWLLLKHFFPSIPSTD